LENGAPLEILSKNSSLIELAADIEENTAVLDTAIKTKDAIIKNRVLVVFILLPVELVLAALRILDDFIFFVPYFSV